MTALGRASYYLRVLHAAEAAYARADRDTLQSVFAGVDPIDVKELAAELLAVDENGGEPTREQTAEVLPAASEPSSSLETEAPFAPVVHSGDTWTQRIHTPCV